MLAVALANHLGATSISGRTGLSSIHALFIGDSNAKQMIEDDSGQAFIDECATYGITATVTDGATSGSTLLKSLASVHWWIDDDDPLNLALDATGGRYQANIAGLSNKNDITDIFCSLTINDLLTSGTQDAVFAEEAYQFLIDEFFRLLPSLERFFIVPLFRPASATNYDEWASYRQIEENLVANNANVHRAGEAYHLKLETTGSLVHLIDAEEPVRQQIVATALAGVGGNTTKKGLGMVVETAQIVDDGILLNITHKDGTDWTLPADSTNTMIPIGIYTGATRLGGILGDIMTKVSATQAKITCPAVSDARVVIVDGALSGMGGGDVDPNVAYDNSPLQLPFGRSTPVISYADPILGMTGMTDAVKSGFAKTYTTGTTIETVKSLNDGEWVRDNTSTTTVIYDATAFGGYGGYVANAVDDRLETSAAVGNEFWQAGVMIVPETPSVDVLWHQLGTNGTPSANNLGWIESTNGNILYKAAEGSTATITVSSGDWRGKTLIMVLDAQSLSTWVLSVYDVAADTTTEFTFDPNNNYTTRNRIYWCGGDATFGDFYYRAGTSLGESGDLTVAQIIAEMKTTHNL